jgi:FMN phosphatase YigB (HAD superfamily)
MPELIIFDVYGTLLYADEEDRVVRPGLRELMDFYKSQFKVTCSDGEEDILEQNLRSAGIYDDFDNHYGAKNLIHEGRLLKNLGRICAESNSQPSEAVFIGDNAYGRDERSAERFGVRFIRVAQFRQNPPAQYEIFSQGDDVEYETRDNLFSFTSLIGKL